MSTHTSQAQTKVAVNDGPPFIIDGQTALDKLYDLLRNQRCRQALSVLAKAQVALYNHLPKLEDLNLIIYDVEKETVEGITGTNSAIHG